VNNFLFEVGQSQNHAVLTFVFTREMGIYEDDVFKVDMTKLQSRGYDGFIKVNSNFDNDIKATGGMSISLDVNKRYAWDKETVICNQKVNYYCSKGWIGSIKLWIKNKMEVQSE
jgi:hypothetical protein